MSGVLLSWIGGRDLDGMTDGAGATGPLISALREGNYDTAELLSNYAPQKTDSYINALKNHFPSLEINCTPVDLPSGPTAYHEIYPAVDNFLNGVFSKYPKEQITVNLSPGTPAMVAVWILLTKTRYPVAYVESYMLSDSRKAVVKPVSLPFSISAELSEQSKTRLATRYTQTAASEVGATANFGNIFGTSEQMLKAKKRAARLAELDVPTLVLGETGTGKELFTKAIANASSRADKPFRTVNCGAIPPELIDSELFGHVKGSFTGASQNREGLFQEAHGGTVFLDEVGELPPDAQVRLLRVLQEGEIRPVGSAQTVHVDVRVIAATHRNLMDMVSKGEFRADLYYRLAVGILELPSLRDREGEIGALADFLMDQINQELRDQPNYEGKKISPDVKNIILGRRWPGNVRELRAALVRAAIWCESDVITVDEFSEYSGSDALTAKDQAVPEVDHSVDINEVISAVVRPYISNAVRRFGGNKTKAAQFLGLNSQQVLSKWIDKHDVEI